MVAVVIFVVVAAGLRAHVTTCWPRSRCFCAGHTMHRYARLTRPSLRHSPGTGCYELVASSQSSSLSRGVDVSQVRHDRGSMIDASSCARHRPSF